MKKSNFYYGTNIKKSNREKTLSVRKNLYWCISCDCQLVGDYGKCPNCGYRNKRKRFKKE